MHILALEPYYGGSHWAFLDGWIARSRHRWTLLTLPAFHWKWRMRHAPLTFAEQLRELEAADESHQAVDWDLLFATDMLDLAQLAGLAPAPVAALPRLLYFHENQLTYPSQHPRARDLHFGMTNALAALAADRVWFNSAFHRDAFLEAVDALFARMPDFAPQAAGERIGERSQVEFPGIDAPPVRDSPRPPGPLRIVWAARWEHDKNPALFFDALERLRKRALPFEVSVLGQSFRSVPEEFERARRRLGQRVRRWGYLEAREDYFRELALADVFVSTAEHEFFGLGAVEAMAAGAYPLLPRRLSYPELLEGLPAASRDRHLYQGGAEALAARLTELAQRLGERGSLWDGGAPGEVSRAMERFFWRVRVPHLDAAIERAARRAPFPRR